MTFSALIGFALVQLVVLSSSASYPSKCVAVWTFNLPCTGPAGDLVNTVKAWSTKKCRDGPERCMYQIMYESPTEVEVTHTSPQTGKMNYIHFVFGSSARKFCKIKAVSTTSSQNDTSPNDYCLLYSLIDGSGLTEAQGYKEICSEKMCASKSSARCNNEEGSRV